MERRSSEPQLQFRLSRPLPRTDSRTQLATAQQDAMQVVVLSMALIFFILGGWMLIIGTLRPDLHTFRDPTPLNSDGGQLTSTAAAGSARLQAVAGNAVAAALPAAVNSEHPPASISSAAIGTQTDADATTTASAQRSGASGGKTAGGGGQAAAATTQNSALVSYHWEPEEPQNVRHPPVLPSGMDTGGLVASSADFGMVLAVLTRVLEEGDYATDMAPQRLRLWLKLTSASSGDGRVALRGFMFFELPNGSGYRFPAASADADTLPALTLACTHRATSGSGSVAEQGVAVTLLEAVHTLRAPWWLHATLPPLPSGGATGYALLLPSASAPVASLSSASLADASPSTPASNPTFHFVIKPYVNITVDGFAALLAHHIAYHRALGFSSWLAYATAALLPGLAAQPALVGVGAAGLLRLLAWDEVAPHWASPTTSDQVMVYNHALLALSGNGAFVAFADTDEYLAAPGQSPPGSVAVLLSQCTATPLQALAAARMPRYHYYCPSCDDAATEAALWLTPQAKDGNATHPLLKYTARRARQSGRRFKAVVHTDTTYAWLIYEGQVLPGAVGREVEVPSNCSFWVNVPSQLTGASNKEQRGMTDTSWHHMLDQLQT